MRGKGGAVFRFRQRLKGQEGFALAEVIVAGIVMVLAMIPIIRMFDGALGSASQLSESHSTIACAQSVCEQIKALPFYQPYSDTDQDIDDFFWGDRNPVTYNPSTESGGPDWASIPEVVYKDYGQMPNYPNCKAGVKLAYLRDDTGLADIRDNWAPKLEGFDKPVNENSDDIHLLIVQINVHWMVDGAETGLYQLLSTVTDSQATYNLGITRITVTGPANLQGSFPNAAVHYPNGAVNVTIDGWGFDPATVQAWLVHTDCVDIPITLAGEKTDSQLVGTVDISTTGTAGHAWAPRADVGKWSVKVRQKNILSVYLYDGFVVEYPKPTISDFYNVADHSKRALDVNGSFTLHVDGGLFVYADKNPSVRLVQVVADGSAGISITGTTTLCTGASKGYASSGCAIEATFDPTGLPCAEYRVEVINTDAGKAGHIGSGLSSTVFIYTNGRPQPRDATNSRGGHFAYADQGNPWRLSITGSDFNTLGASPQVQVSLCSQVSENNPAGHHTEGNLVSVSSNTIVADFDLSILVPGYYLIWVKNMNNDTVGWTSNQPFEVRGFAPSLSGFFPDAGYAFYENYWDIHATITGSQLGVASSVKIVNGAQIYDITSDCTFGDDASIPLNLNLIDCSHNGNWKIQVSFPGGTTLERDFSVAVGPARILVASNSRPAIRIRAKHGGDGPQWNAETASAQAWAWRTTSFVFTTYGYGLFEVHGMGFVLGGSTTLRVWSGSWNKEANLVCVTNRAAKDVYIISHTSGDGWQLPAATGGCGISVQNASGNTAVDSYSSRWNLQ